MSDATATPFDPSRCPLCGGDNRCAMDIERATGQPQPPCWCVTQAFPPALLERLPPQAQGMACICARCVAAHAAGGEA
jgi:hypothetical protein